MIKIRGQGATAAQMTHNSPKHANYFRLRWIIVDTTITNSAGGPTQVLLSTVSGTPTISIERQFIEDNDQYWEALAVNPLDLKNTDGVPLTFIEGGTYRYTVRNLDAKYEVWLAPTHISL